MAHILDVDSATNFMRGKSGVTGGDLADEELLEGYLGAVDWVIEDIVGPVVPATRTFMCAGGRRTVMLEHAARSITSVSEGDTVLAASSYTYDPLSATIARGTAASPGRWADGPVTVIAEVGRDPIPANITLAAKELLRHLWKPRQGARPAMGGRTSEDGAYLQTTWVPSGFAVPHMVAELLEPTPDVPGFA